MAAHRAKQTPEEHQIQNAKTAQAMSAHRENQTPEERQIQNIIKDSHATIVTVSPEFFVIEKTGFREETEQLRKDLAPYGILQFVRSGRISVTKAKMGISEILNTFKNNN